MSERPSKGPEATTRRLQLRRVALVACTLSSILVASASAQIADISASWVETRARTPPRRTVFVRLEIANHRDQPTWYITRYYGDRPLPDDTPFQARVPWKTEQLAVKASSGQRHGGAGSFRMVSFVGAEHPVAHSFVAFLLPAGGHLAHDFFPLEAWSDVASCEIWEASALKVNGRIPLEEWLPYVVASDESTHITREAATTTTDRDAFQWKPGNSAHDVAAVQVQAIVPTILTKRTLPIRGAPEPEQGR